MCVCVHTVLYYDTPYLQFQFRTSTPDSPTTPYRLVSSLARSRLRIVSCTSYEGKGKCGMTTIEMGPPQFCLEGPRFTFTFCYFFLFFFFGFHADSFSALGLGNAGCGGGGGGVGGGDGGGGWWWWWFDARNRLDLVLGRGGLGFCLFLLQLPR